MVFEPIDADLEDALAEIIETVGNAPGRKMAWSSEIRELIELGMVDKEMSHPYKDGSGLVYLSRQGRRYFAKKQEHEDLQERQKKSGILSKAAQIAGTYTGAVIKEINDL